MAMGAVMGSLTGVGGPPLMIWILALEIPNAFVKINYTISGLPITFLRFGMSISEGMITWNFWPFYVSSVVASIVGLVVGMRIGALFGPRSFMILVLVILTLASLVMLTDSITVLLGSVVSSAAAVMVSVIREQADVSVGSQLSMLAEDPVHPDVGMDLML